MDFTGKEPLSQVLPMGSGRVVRGIVEGGGSSLSPIRGRQQLRATIANLVQCQFLSTWLS